MFSECVWELCSIFYFYFVLSQSIKLMLMHTKLNIGGQSAVPQTTQCLKNLILHLCSQYLSAPWHRCQRSPVLLGLVSHLSCYNPPWFLLIKVMPNNHKPVVQSNKVVHKYCSLEIWYLLYLCFLYCILLVYIKIIYNILYKSKTLF